MSIRKKLFTVLMGLALLVCTLFSNVSTELIYAATPPNMKVIYVNHGASSIIECDGKYILIDAGGNINNVQDVIEDNSITEFEYVIITHYDGDHIQGLEQILKQNDFDSSNDIRVKHFIGRKYSRATLEKIKNNSDACFKNYIRLVNAVSKSMGYCYQSGQTEISYKTADVTTVINYINILNKLPNYNWLAPYRNAPNDSFSISEINIGNFKITFLNKQYTFITDSNLQDTTYNSNTRFSNLINDDSVAFKMQYNNKTVLCVGDMYYKGTKELVNNYGSTGLKCNTLMVPHHGILYSYDNSAWPKSFFAAVKPSIAIIQNGESSSTSTLNSVRTALKAVNKNVKIYEIKSYKNAKYLDSSLISMF